MDAAGLCFNEGEILRETTKTLQRGKCWTDDDVGGRNRETEFTTAILETYRQKVTERGIARGGLRKRVKKKGESEREKEIEMDEVRGGKIDSEIE